MVDYWRNHTGRMLLHACCGPCSLEPVRALRESGADIDIYYSNSNIAPDAEYERRLETLRAYWEDPPEDGATPLVVIEGTRDPGSWERACGQPFLAGKISREQRCRECYRIRFEDAARHASAHGYSSLGTTLSVSPYQYTDIIRQELESACANHGLECAFDDYRPYYEEARRRSRDAGMYRQNYCGCALSAAEAEEERTERREKRKAEKARRQEALADARAAEEAKLQKRRQERRAYDDKKAKQRKILREMRKGAKPDGPGGADR